MFLEGQTATSANHPFSFDSGKCVYVWHIWFFYDSKINEHLSNLVSPQSQFSNPSVLKRCPLITAWLWVSSFFVFSSSDSEGVVPRGNCGRFLSLLTHLKRWRGWWCLYMWLVVESLTQWWEKKRIVSAEHFNPWPWVSMYGAGVCRTLLCLSVRAPALVEPLKSLWMVHEGSSAKLNPQAYPGKEDLHPRFSSEWVHFLSAQQSPYFWVVGLGEIFTFFFTFLPIIWIFYRLIYHLYKTNK